jgi:leucyl-tRNA synthetase
MIQINGKLRDKMESNINISEEDTTKKVLKREKIKKWIQGKEIKKIIFVPGKLINIVI